MKLLTGKRHRIHPPENPRQKRQATAVYLQSFGHNFKPLSQSFLKQVRLLEQNINPDRTIVVFEDDKVVGIAGMRFHGRQMYHFSLKLLINEMGVFQGILSWLAIGFICKNQDRNELLIDGLTVRKGYRGKGVGRLMVQEIQRVATEEGLEWVRLSVAVGNDAALHLYQSCGFSVTYPDTFLGQEGPEKIEMIWKCGD